MLMPKEWRSVARVSAASVMVLTKTEEGLLPGMLWRVNAERKANNPLQ
jgi:hypothetical protein